VIREIADEDRGFSGMLADGRRRREAAPG